MEVAHTPLACLLVIASNGKAPAQTFDVSKYAEVSPDVRTPIEGRLEIGFGNTPLLGDYRTKAAIDADAGGSSIFVPRQTVS